MKIFKDYSVKLSEFEIGLSAAGLAVVKTIQALVGFLEFFGSVVEGGGGMHGGGYGHGHFGGQDGAVDAFDALRGHSEYFRHGGCCF